MSLLPLSVLKKRLQVQKQVNSGLNFEDVNVDLKKLMFLKPIHVTWLVEMYNFLTLHSIQVMGLLHNFVKEKDLVPGIVYHSKREIKVT